MFCTLQCVHNKLAYVESEETIAYIDQVDQSLGPRPNMTCIGPHIYAVGKCKAAVPTVEQASALDLLCNSIDDFSRLLKDRFMHSSTSYLRSGQGKRDDTHRYCLDDNGRSCIGVIELNQKSAIVKRVKNFTTHLD